MATSLIHPNSDDKSMTNPDPWNGDLDWFVNDRVYTLASPPWTTLATRTPFMNNTEDWRKSLRSSFYDGDAPLQSFYGRSRRYGAPHCTIFTTASLQLSIIIIIFYHYLSYYKGCTIFTTDALQLEMKTEHLRLSLLLENYPLERDWIGWENIYLHLHIEDPAHLIPQPFVFAIKPSILLQMVIVQLIGLFSAQ